MSTIENNRLKVSFRMTPEPGAHCRFETMGVVREASSKAEAMTS